MGSFRPVPADDLCIFASIHSAELRRLENTLFLENQIVNDHDHLLFRMLIRLYDVSKESI